MLHQNGYTYIALTRRCPPRRRGLKYSQPGLVSEGVGPPPPPRTMPSKRGSQPVSRDLVRIIRESSKAEGGATLVEHLQAVEARQTKAVEFYLRACALRLSQAP